MLVKQNWAFVWCLKYAYFFTIFEPGDAYKGGAYKKPVYVDIKKQYT